VYHTLPPEKSKDTVGQAGQQSSICVICQWHCYLSV